MDSRVSTTAFPYYKDRIPWIQVLEPSDLMDPGSGTLGSHGSRVLVLWIQGLDPRISWLGTSDPVDPGLGTLGIHGFQGLAS